MPVTIKLLKTRPMAAKGWRATCACDGRSRRWVSSMTCASSLGRISKKPAHRAQQPFGQIPTYEDGDLVLFESGAIVLHIAQNHRGLLPEDFNVRARAIMWMFAAVATLEQPAIDVEINTYFEQDKLWGAERRRAVAERLRTRLADLSAYPWRARITRGCFQRRRSDDDRSSAAGRGRACRLCEPARLCRSWAGTVGVPARVCCPKGRRRRCGE